MPKTQWNTVYHTSAGITLYGTKRVAKKNVLAKKTVDEIPWSEIKEIFRYVVENLTQEHINQLKNQGIHINNLVYTLADGTSVDLKGLEVKSPKQVDKIPSVEARKNKKSLLPKVYNNWDEIIITPTTNVLNRTSVIDVNEKQLETDYCLDTNKPSLSRVLSVEVKEIHWKTIAWVRNITFKDAPLTSERIEDLTKNNVSVSCITINAPIATSDLSRLPSAVIVAEGQTFPPKTVLPKLRALWAKEADLTAFSEINASSLVDLHDAKIAEGLKITFAKKGHLIIDGDNLNKISEISNLSKLTIRGGSVNDESLQFLTKHKNLTLIFEGVDMSGIQRTTFARPNISHMAVTNIIDLQTFDVLKYSVLPYDFNKLTKNTGRYLGSLSAAYNFQWENLFPVPTENKNKPSEHKDNKSIGMCPLCPVLNPFIPPHERTR